MSDFFDDDLLDEESDEDIVLSDQFSGTLSPEYRMSLEKDYRKWLKEKVDTDITEQRVKDALLSDLSFLSKMGVEEYTLYRKWAEIHRKYPHDEQLGKKAGTFFDLTNTDCYPEIEAIAKNIWMPKDAMDFRRLRPKITWTKDESDLTVLWNDLRTFIHTQINNSNIGRNLYFIVTDEVTGKYLGVFAMSSDFMDLTPRDKYIGWTNEMKTTKRMLNHTSIGSTICPTQPLGYNYVGGKLVALLTISDVAEKTWNDHYKDKLVGVTTTSLYSSFSQYQNLSYWTKRGHSSGSIKFEPSKQTLELVKQYLQKTVPRKYWEWYVATEPQGMPLKRDYKQRSLAYLYPKLKIEKSFYETNHQRGIYFCPLFTNTNEYLRMEIDESKLVRRFDNSVDALVEIWKEKYASKRINSLTEQGRVSNETLFYNDVITMDWEQTKAKYLKEVGR